MNATQFRTEIREAGLSIKAAGELLNIGEATIRRLASPSRTDEIPLRYELALSAALARRDREQGDK